MGVRFTIEGNEPLRGQLLLEKRGEIVVRVDIHVPNDRILLENAITALDRMASEARQQLSDWLEAERVKTQRALDAVRDSRAGEV